MLIGKCKIRVHEFFLCFQRPVILESKVNAMMGVKTAAAQKKELVGSSKLCENSIGFENLTLKQL